MKEGNIIEEKICNVCYRKLPLSKFKKHKYKNKIYYDNTCKSCRSKKEGHSVTNNDEITDELIIQVYNKLLIGELKNIPSIIGNKRKDYKKVIVKYIIKDVLKCNTKESVCEYFNGNTFNKYKLCDYGNLMKLLEEIFPEYNIKPWELKYGNIHGMYDKDEDKKECIQWFINKLISDNIINEDIEILKRPDIYKLFQGYSIGGLLVKFNKSSTKVLMWYFNNFTNYKINEWDFYVPPRNFWNKENSIRAFKWLLNVLGYNETWDKEKRKEFVINNINKEIFTQYNIYGCYQYFKSIYNAYTKSYNEELFYQWELNHTPNNFWSNKNNRDIALKQLIENILHINKKDIPKYIKQSALKNTIYNKFNMPCINYYKGNYFYWINEIYPNEFTEEDFKVFKAKDGTILLSNEELRIYEYIKDEMKIKIRYIGKKRDKKYCYKHDGIEFRPDFVIENILNKPIIIEHFGFYSKNPTNKIFIDYKNKTEKKIEYFQNNKDVYFIALFPEDLRFNYSNIQDKINCILN